MPLAARSAALPVGPICARAMARSMVLRRRLPERGKLRVVLCFEDDNPPPPSFAFPSALRLVLACVRSWGARLAALPGAPSGVLLFALLRLPPIAELGLSQDLTVVSDAALSAPSGAPLLDPPYVSAGARPMVGWCCAACWSV